MVSFSFDTTPSILVEPGATARIGALLAARGCRHVALVTDPGVRAAGLVQAALDGLANAGVAVTLWSDVVADPPDTVVLAAAAAARGAGVDGVCAVGGGSSLDVAKLVAVLLGGPQPLAEMYGVGKVAGPRLPLILAPTTAGTGSEATPIAIVTTGETTKAGIVSPQLLPDVAVLDAALTTGLPAAVTAATGIDAMVHAIEATTSRHRRNPVSDCLAREALRLLAGNIRTVCATPGDLAARGAMLLGSLLAGMAFANAPVAAVHALAYPLGGRFKVAHGLSNALVLPHVLAYNRSAAETTYADLAPILFPGCAGLDSAARVTAMIEGLAALGPELGLPGRLSQVGVGPGDLAMLAHDAMQQTRLLVNNPREMTQEAALAIYRSAL